MSTDATAPSWLSKYTSSSPSPDDALPPPPAAADNPDATQQAPPASADPANLPQEEARLPEQGHVAATRALWGAPQKAVPSRAGDLQGSTGPAAQGGEPVSWLKKYTADEAAGKASVEASRSPTPPPPMTNTAASDALTGKTSPEGTPDPAGEQAEEPARASATGTGQTTETGAVPESVKEVEGKEATPAPESSSAAALDNKKPSVTEAVQQPQQVENEDESKVSTGAEWLDKYVSSAREGAASKSPTPPPPPAAEGQAATGEDEPPATALGTKDKESMAHSAQECVEKAEPEVVEDEAPHEPGRQDEPATRGSTPGSGEEGEYPAQPDYATNKGKKKKRNPFHKLKKMMSKDYREMRRSMGRVEGPESGSSSPAAPKMSMESTELLSALRAPAPSEASPDATEKPPQAAEGEPTAEAVPSGTGERVQGEGGPALSPPELDSKGEAVAEADTTAAPEANESFAGFGSEVGKDASSLSMDESFAGFGQDEEQSSKAEAEDGGGKRPIGTDTLQDSGAPVADTALPGGNSPKSTSPNLRGARPPPAGLGTKAPQNNAFAPRGGSNQRKASAAGSLKELKRTRSQNQLASPLGSATFDTALEDLQVSPLQFNAQIDRMRVSSIAQSRRRAPSVKGRAALRAQRSSSSIFDGMDVEAAGPKKVDGDGKMASEAGEGGEGSEEAEKKVPPPVADKPKMVKPKKVMGHNPAAAALANVLGGGFPKLKAADSAVDPTEEDGNASVAQDAEESGETPSANPEEAEDESVAPLAAHPVASRETKSTRTRKHMSMNIAGELQGILGGRSSGPAGRGGRRQSAALDRLVTPAKPFAPAAALAEQPEEGGIGRDRAPSVKLGQGAGQGETDAV